jgi:hypothetical protein
MVRLFIWLSRVPITVRWAFAVATPSQTVQQMRSVFDEAQ